MRRRLLACVTAVVALAFSTAVVPASATGEPAGPECRGMTWSLRDKLFDRHIALVSSDRTTDPYNGDTPCDRKLPVLCLKKLNLPQPGGIEVDSYKGWTGGRIQLTAPVAGTTLTSPAAADQLCADTFGTGWEMGEFHDGYGGWAWWARGEPMRLWVAVRDQPANPWDTETGHAMTWTTRFHRWEGDIARYGTDDFTNPYTGDTELTERLPILCVKPDGTPVPPVVDPTDEHNGWAAASAQISAPVRGTELTSRAAADKVCADEFGTGYRMADYHEGGGTDIVPDHAWWANGDVGRFWVSINDQRANPWNFPRT
ncbi:hypothetical protein V5P93_002150 [Actinokineospora auranticolor]|uniref:Uncharacterized protein n=1 Tax=Actinokineospora auranticolor TaxID=155976 RepID=A0A2S6GB78_9PSEU|nr:hypothetical protein [Actinokineospora auranticolor]PPK60989.1 hypothetical protein CLV40_1453 [Actinokineospora auranticolor]